MPGFHFVDARSLVTPARRVWAQVGRPFAGLGFLGDVTAPVSSSLWLLQNSLAQAQAAVSGDTDPSDIAIDQSMVDHYQAQVTASLSDPTDPGGVTGNGDVANQAVADNKAATDAFAAATNADPTQTAGKTWLQWFAATPVAAAIIKTGAFTAGATGFNQTAVSAAILKYDDPRLNAAGANAAGKAVGDFLGKYWKVLLVGVGLAVAGGAYKRVRG